MSSAPRSLKISLAFGFVAKILYAFLSYLVHIAYYAHFILLDLWDKRGGGITMDIW
jgi:hypothetical protein